MRRKRVGETRIRVFKYWSAPIGRFPPEFWNTVERMVAFWNQLVALQDLTRFSAETLPDHADTFYRRFWDLLTGPSAEFRLWRKHVKSESGLNWEARDEVFDRFITAAQQAAKKRRGWPVQQRNAETISIPHNFTGGGLQPAALFRKPGGRTWRFGLDRVEDWAYEGKSRAHTNARLTKGFFGISPDACFEFRTVLHRPLPVAAFVKRVNWMGKRHPVKGWEWAIAMIVEEPVSTVDNQSSRPSCGIYFGWRAMGEYIRVGMVCDSEGNSIEIRLPINNPTAHTRRFGLKASWEDLADINREMSELLEETKAELNRRLQSKLPEAVQGFVQRLPKLRQGGLVGLLRVLEEQTSSGDLLELLHRWLRKNDRLRWQRAALQDRLVGRREWLYRNAAAFLAQRYKHIVLWEDFAITRIVTNSKVDDFALLPARRYQEWSAPGQLRDYLVEAVQKTGGALTKAKPCRERRNCQVCGTEIRDRRLFNLVCENGHQVDQDVDSALSLLEMSDKPSEIGVGVSVESSIPPVLRNVLCCRRISQANSIVS